MPFRSKYYISRMECILHATSGNIAFLSLKQRESSGKIVTKVILYNKNIVLICSLFLIPQMATGILKFLVVAVLAVTLSSSTPS